MSKATTSHLEKSEISHIENEDRSLTDLKQSESEFAFSNEVEDEYANLPESLQGLTPEELTKLEKKTTRKIDIRLMPMLIYIYILNYLDRNNIASARLAGLEKDIGLVGNQYQTCISVLFAGYILFQVPSNMLLNKLGRPSIYITVVMTIWGVLSTCTGAVQSYGGLLAIRILLGVVESKTLASRNSILYAGSLISSAFSGLIAAGILKIPGLKGQSWRWLFIVEGGLTVASVPFAYFVLPDNPSNTKFLSQQEKDIIMWKMSKDVGVKDSDQVNEESDLQGFFSACKDIKVWILCGTHSWLVAACGVTNFFPTVVETLNFSRTITLVLTAPPYLIAVVATFLWARHADKSGERMLHVVIPLILSLVSFIIAACTLNTGARYFAMCLMVPSLYCAFVVILTWISNTVPRPPAKRAAAIAIVNCLSNSTSIWNAYLYPSGDGPRYMIAFICNCVFIALAIAFALGLAVRLRILNKKIDNGSLNWEREFGKGFDASKINADFRFLH
ncbi:unnamed protein product [Candida verbasci]|uniref:Major facilitator superfamily (MFS) profile domain-containing protein n=1 Tax=Candida verbasci TaxID=1227364 RepID=A0A9W4TQZ3_9ASCO|nr:unnamed protein product [Candida verbasci]